MTMTIRKEKDNTYTVDISFGFNPISKKRKRIRKFGFKKKATAIEYENALKFAYKDNLPAQKITFEALYNLYSDQTIDEHKLSYVKTQETNYKTHIYPYFQDTNVTKITKEDIKDFREYLTNKALSNNTTNKIILLTKQILDVGISKHIINENPAKGLKKLPIEKKQMKFWTPDQFKVFLAAIHEDELPYAIFYKTAYLTGMRVGELLALNWTDIDFANNYIFVSKTYNFFDGQPNITTPKTKYSNRKIKINPKLAAELQSWKIHQKNLFEKFLIEHSDSTLIFQFRIDYSTKHTFGKKLITICKRTTLDPIRLHDLRHSHVALLIYQKEDYNTIKERLGHSSITTTIDVYGHLFPDKQDSIANKLDSLF